MISKTENNCGLTESEITQLIVIFQKYNLLEKAIVFGSRAKGNSKYNSDVDIALKGNIDFTTFAQINDDLQEGLTIPYKFDLVVYNKIENVNLKEHIDRVGIEIYSRD